MKIFKKNRKLENIKEVLISDNSKLKEKEKISNIKYNKGITLIALIITVIIMLILASVAISAVLRGGNLFSKTREAVASYESAAEDEASQVSSFMDKINRILSERDTDGSGGGNTGNEEPIINPENTIVKVNQTYDGLTEGTYDNPIIPKGFAPINENGAVWGTEEGYKSGLVITDEITDGVSTGNEFVWVPVDGNNVTFERHEFGTGSRTVSECSEILPAALTTSITENGGFYIARFEAGIAEGMATPTADTTATYGNGNYKPVSKQGATAWKYIQWGANNSERNPGNGVATVARNMYPENDENYGATSTLIYGVQWDTALKFIQAYDIGEEGYSTYATDSTGYGNYNGTDGAGDTFSSISEPTTCGAAIQFRQKNIYDMAGNVFEWTMETYNSKRILRGGYYKNYGSDFPASHRIAYEVTHCDGNDGFRCALYIKGETKENEEIDYVENIASVGDFVNYSVEVDGVTYDEWRILHFDTVNEEDTGTESGQAHVEIVCYNGPAYKLGEGSGETTDTEIINEAESDWITAVYQLNTASEEYKNGTYGYSARHLGSNRVYPNRYATLSTEAQAQIKFLGETVPTELTDEGIDGNALFTDINIIATFSGDAKLSGENGTDGYIWSASRYVRLNSTNTYFGVNRVTASSGMSSGCGLRCVFSGGGQYAYGDEYALAPVVSLEAGIKIDTTAGGNGSEGSPWVLTK